MSDKSPEADLPKSRKSDFAEYQHPDDASFDKFVSALDRAYHKPFKMMGRAFLYGMASILGGTVGATIIFIILFYVLRGLDFAPYIKDFQKVIIPEKIEKLLDGESTASTTTMDALTEKYLNDPVFRAQVDAQVAANQQKQ